MGGGASSLGRRGSSSKPGARGAAEGGVNDGGVDGGVDGGALRALFGGGAAAGGLDLDLEPI